MRALRPLRRLVAIEVVARALRVVEPLSCWSCHLVTRRRESWCARAWRRRRECWRARRQNRWTVNKKSP